MQTYLVRPSQVEIIDDINNEEKIIVIQLEEGEVVLTKEETRELGEVLCTEYISTDFPNAKEAVRKLLRNRK